MSRELAVAMGTDEVSAVSRARAGAQRSSEEDGLELDLGVEAGIAGEGAGELVVEVGLHRCNKLRPDRAAFPGARGRNPVTAEGWSESPRRGGGGVQAKGMVASGEISKPGNSCREMRSL